VKSATLDEFRLALGRVSRGERYVSADIDRELGELPDDRAAGLPALSSREREVFDLVITGSSNVDVAAALFISIKTVETHRSRINRKLGVHSTAQLMRFAALSGIVRA
jgi:DNA-binding NarL/FixJ family response regulator